MGLLLSKIPTPVKEEEVEDTYGFVESIPCDCSPSNRISQRMVIPTVRLAENYADLRKAIFVDQDSVTIYFKCLNCDSECTFTADYFKKKSRQRFGYYSVTYKECRKAKIRLFFNEMKPIFDKFSLTGRNYSSTDYAFDLYNALIKHEKCPI